MGGPRIEVLFSKKRHTRFKTAEYSKGPIGGSAEREEAFLDSLADSEMRIFHQFIFYELAQSGVFLQIVQAGQLTIDEIDKLDTYFYSNDDLDENDILVFIIGKEETPLNSVQIQFTGTNMETDVSHPITWKKWKKR